MSEQQEYKLPETKERLGFFGFALGLILWFVGFLILNVVPYGSSIISLFYVPFEFYFAYIMTYIYPIIFAVPFFFIRRKKTKI